MGQKGAEGAKDDDWLCVDCYDSVVHFMLPCECSQQQIALEQQNTVLSSTTSTGLHDVNASAKYEGSP